MNLSLIVKTIICSAVLNLQSYAGNYQVTIEGKKYEIDLGKNATIELANGKKLDLIFKKKDLLTFEGAKFSFDHPNKFTPSRSDLGEGVYQTTIMSPTGSGIIVQEYSLNLPTDMVDLMILELTKEEAEVGYKITKSPIKIPISKEITLKGKRVVSSIKDSGTILQVISYAKKGSGVLVITRMDKDATDEEKLLLKTFWSTLKISLK
jgi:hypothetical protein